MPPSVPQITQLLAAWSTGDQNAFEQLIPLVYAELHRMARRYMKQQDPGHALQTTALIHEAYLRLAGDAGTRWEHRSHFYAVAATAMRHVLVDYARAAHTGKRGSGSPPLALDEALTVSRERLGEVIALDDALTDLAKLNARQSRVVELRFFCGLSVEESAGILKVSPETVMRDWRAAKAWLYAELKQGTGDDRGSGE